MKPLKVNSKMYWRIFIFALSAPIKIAQFWTRPIKAYQNIIPQAKFVFISSHFSFSYSFIHSKINIVSVVRFSVGKI